ncbi:hypothetical protein TNCV_3644641 [Trichonephila clavipes]|nr:hypothetical protein TNCV_3644641 [Trichonephila clavipes]
MPQSVGAGGQIQPDERQRALRAGLHQNAQGHRQPGRGQEDQDEGQLSHQGLTAAPLNSPCRNCGGGDRGRVAIYRPFGEFRRAKSYCHLYGAQGQRQAYLLPMPR